MARVLVISNLEPDSSQSKHLCALIICRAPLRTSCGFDKKKLVTMYKKSILTSCQEAAGEHASEATAQTYTAQNHQDTAHFCGA